MQLRARRPPVLKLVASEGAPEAAAPITVPSPPALDDAEICAAVGRGDGSAASALYARVRPHVDRAIAQLLGRRDSDHDDLAQLSMIEIVRSMPRFRGECSLNTWASRIAARTVFRELRRRRSERRLFDGQHPVDELDDTRDLERAVGLRSTLHRVRRHFDAIDPLKAWTVMLHDVCGYDLREVAEITGASVAAAQTRLVRGRGELNAQIAADPELADLLERTERSP